MNAGLAYVFWHWKAESVGAESYEAMARDFHASLARRRPEGFVASVSFGISGAGWVADAGAAYEDWYRIESSAALDHLDQAAISPPHRAPHDAIARAAAGGTGGLYRLRRGVPLDGEARFALWCQKPAGMTYDSLYALLEPLTAAGATALWGRQMTLGPAPEFCLHAREPVDLPRPLEPVSVPLRALRP